MRIEAPAGEFNLSRLERVIYGPSKVAALKEEMERRNLHRALVVTTHGVAELPIMAQVTGALNGRCAGVFAGVVMHVPRKTTEALQQEIESVNADCVVSFGGGSPIDSCKAAAFGLLEKREVIHIAIPTTLFGGGVYLGRRRHRRIHARQKRHRL